ncbi:glutathione S-transferase family protein [Pseudoduganella lutea]|uniref:Glutathione S-transferase n=1 Tax=Pseudoduganella lutea TaxID=321985 RepID=A0A4P6L1S6_9BURK|nr:glutathione S-transferase N-terminal domain-containing protein [Pseudoduganella lutea]QBE64698.1 glutathione S-transferase [Pseudoduganella lutea]
MYKLFYSPGAASLAVHAAIHESGAAHELVNVDLNVPRTDDYLRLNPQGTVPTLVIDGLAHRESAALLILLAERHPEANLAPAPGTPGRAEWLQWTVALATSLGGPFRLWFYPRDLGLEAHDENSRAPVRRTLEAGFERIASHLQAHGPYLLGERFSIADYQLCMYMRWSRAMPKPATEWPELDRLARLVSARPAWRNAVAMEGLRGWHLDSAEPVQ